MSNSDSQIFYFCWNPILLVLVLSKIYFIYKIE